LALVTPQDGNDAEIDSALRAAVTRDVVEHDYAILLTAASPGSIPASIWRSSHVIYL
jgi:hypothetical protein